jgi:hypothetical protein
MGSAGVFDWGYDDSTSEADLFIASDDAYLWGFDNTAALPTPWERPTSLTYISSTAALTPDRYMIFWSELPTNLYLWSYGGDEPSDSTSLALGVSQWIHGAPALDSWGRFIVNTPSPDPFDPEECECPDAGRIICYELIWDGDVKKFVETWRYPDANPFIIDVEEEPDNWPAYFAPVALDEDGTVICVGWTGAPSYKSYLFALRPPVGDLNGDGISNWDDAPALVLALVDPEGWEAQYGAVYGINLLGVGDGNNDALFNNFDITPIRTRWDAYGDSEGREGQWNYYRLLIDELIEHFAQEEGS